MLLERIKSAYEVALERIKQRKEVPQAEIDRMDYEPVGKTIAAAFLREKDYDLLAEIKRYPQQYREYIIEGVQQTLFNNILPPKDKNTLEANLKAMQGIVLIKKNKKAVEEILGQLENLFKYYEQALEHTYSAFKQRYLEKLGPTIRAVEKRTGQKFNIDPEKQPGFREEWNKVLVQLNSQYENVLDDQKEKLRNIS